MNTIVSLYSIKNGEIEKFLNRFFNDSGFDISNDLKWEKEYRQFY